MDDYTNLAIQTLSQSIKRAIEQYITMAHFDVTLQGRVKGATQDKTGYYDIEIDGNTYSVKSELNLHTNDFVNVMSPQNNPSNMFVYVYKPSECCVEYEFTQTTATSTWNITHNLNKFPNVLIINNNNTLVNPTSVVYTSKNSVSVIFSSATAGTAILR